MSSPNYINNVNHVHHEFDVFFSRGHGVDKYNGNKFYRQLIRIYSQDYKTAPSNKEKRRISNQVVNTIRSNGGKFYHLEEDGGFEWKEVPVKPLMRKIGQALRDNKEKEIGQNEATQMKQVIVKETNLCETMQEEEGEKVESSLEMKNEHEDFTDIIEQESLEMKNEHEDFTDIIEQESRSNQSCDINEMMESFLSEPS